MMAAQMEKPDPMPWEGWFEEHPDGGIIFTYKDGPSSSILRSYEDIAEYVARAASEGWQHGPPHIIRIRHAATDSSELDGMLDGMLGTLYPPEGGDA